jgi:hypothetical protein
MPNIYSGTGPLACGGVSTFHNTRRRLDVSTRLEPPPKESDPIRAFVFTSRLRRQHVQHRFRDPRELRQRRNSTATLLSQRQVLVCQLSRQARTQSVGPALIKSITICTLILRPVRAVVSNCGRSACWGIKPFVRVSTSLIDWLDPFHSHPLPHVHAPHSPCSPSAFYPSPPSSALWRPPRLQLFSSGRPAPRTAPRQTIRAARSSSRRWFRISICYTASGRMARRRAATTMPTTRLMA